MDNITTPNGQFQLIVTDMHYFNTLVLLYDDIESITHIVRTWENNDRFTLLPYDPEGYLLDIDKEVVDGEKKGENISP